MNFDDVESYLYGLKHSVAKYGIDRMRVLGERMGYPEKRFPTIHVAGTNGKGSVCAMLEAIYREAGYRTGLFTSPHLVYIGERIKVNGLSIEKDELVRYVEALKPLADSIGAIDFEDHPSFFEFINAIAFQYFADMGVEIGIMETGLGGENDSTNVINPLASIITTISWDHSEILGDSLKQIAKAKAGIIKEKVPLVIGKLREEIKYVIESVAESNKSEIFELDKRFAGNLPKTVLKGKHQRYNAGIAQLTVEVLKNQVFVSDRDIHKGLKKVKWPGRFEEIEGPGGRKVILDVAHNEEGAEALGKNLKELRGERSNQLVLAMGATSERQGKSIIEYLSAYANQIVLVEGKDSRLVSAETLSKYVPEVFLKHLKVLDVKHLMRFNFCDANDIVLITGSIYIVGEFLKLRDISCGIRTT